MKKILFVGAGSMAEAIIAGLVQKKVVSPLSIYVMNKSDDQRLKELQEKYGVSIVAKDKKELQEMSLAVLATKPQDVAQAMKDVKAHLADDCAMLSVIAGVSMASMESIIGSRPIARSMPNTSATIGKSATGISFNRKVTEKMQQEMIALLESIGLVKVVVEEDLHAVTALSGSGPAYIYYLVEALEEAAIQEGLSKEVARALILQTLEGATAMLKETNEEPAVLREHVTSPNGTTFAGLQALERGNFKNLLGECISDASNRSKELSKLTKS